MPWGHASLNGSRVEAYAEGGYKGECDLPYICLGMGWIFWLFSAHRLLDTL
jgi:hypothetical protein